MNCKKCYGKGYSTRITHRVCSPDFPGDKGSREVIAEAKVCSCERGKELLKYFVKK